MKLLIAENDTHDGKRKCETLWPIFKIAHQKSRYIFDLYHRRKEISKELYEFCLDQGYADRNLIAKWKKVSATFTRAFTHKTPFLTFPLKMNIVFTGALTCYVSWGYNSTMANNLYLKL